MEIKTQSSNWQEGMYETNRLVSIDQSGYVLSSALRIDGGDDVEMEMHQSWGFSGFAHVMPGAQVVRTEAVEVGGRTYQCKVWQGSWQDKKEMMVCTSWVSENHDLPLRWRVSSPSGLIELTMVQPNDFAKIDRRKIPAARYEGGGRMSNDKVTVRGWMSLEVPGGMVRMETKNGDEVVVRQIQKFRCTPRKSR